MTLSPVNLSPASEEARANPARALRPKERVPLPRELRLFWICSIAAFLLTILVGWLKYRAGQSRYHWDPLSDPLFGDLDEYPGTFTLLHQASFFFNLQGWPYPMF